MFVYKNKNAAKLCIFFELRKYFKEKKMIFIKMFEKVVSYQQGGGLRCVRGRCMSTYQITALS